MKALLQRLIAYLARKVVQKYKPIVVGITGSVGKTSAKEAVYLVVSQKYKTRKSEKNFNNEFGLPFTVLGVASPGRSLLKWLGVIGKGLLLLVSKREYPEVLVLEMGVDRPGDMDYLLSIAKPNIAIITTIGISHYEFFKNIEAIEKEKTKIAGFLTKNDWLIVNGNDPIASTKVQGVKAHTLTYGKGHGPQVSVESSREVIIGTTQTHFMAVTPTRTFEAWLNALGESHLLSAACGIAVGEALKMETDAIARGLTKYRPAPGRLNVLPAIKRSLVIDDTYNAAPHSMLAALTLLERLPGSSKIAVLGDMLELGELSYEQHENIGKLVASMHIDKLVTVGARGKLMADKAKENGMDSQNVFSFDTSDEAKKFVQSLMPPECVVLVKGSQGMRMEKVTKEIMAEPDKAEELLCRQYGGWLE